jgi:NADP-dependent 3-hydroxy acid dehydrogenase YdfG
MTQDLNGKIALVTGASRGVGRASAEWLAARGAHVVAVARTIGGLEDLDDQIKAKGGSATLAPMDITDDNALAHLCRSIHDRWGQLDIWVHSALHITPLTPVHHIKAKDLDKVIATNIRAFTRAIAMIEPLLTASSRPQAVFFDDTAEPKFSGAYAISKAAQRALVQTWQAETRKTDLRIHMMTPNPMPTAKRGRFFPGEDKTKLAPTKDEIALLLPALLAD